MYSSNNSFSDRFNTSYLKRNSVNQNHPTRHILDNFISPNTGYKGQYYWTMDNDRNNHLQQNCVTPVVQPTDNNHQSGTNALLTTENSQSSNSFIPHIPDHDSVVKIPSWKVPSNYLRRVTKPQPEDANEIFEVITNLNPHKPFENYCQLWEQQKIHYYGVLKYSEECAKKQIVENITILGLEHAGLKVKNFSDACELFASEEGIKDHERLWQVIIFK